MANQQKYSRSSHQCIITGEFDIIQSPGESWPIKPPLVRIYSATEVSPSTERGKSSEQEKLKRGDIKMENDIKIRTYRLKIYVEQNFGIPGAFVIINRHKHKFFLESATLYAPDKQNIHFDCRSWVYPFKLTKTERRFFSNTSYLPNQTPKGLVQLRREELESLRGNVSGERRECDRECDRIYKYDVYNDLGNPDRGREHSRPVLGGTDHPYPRRGKTGRPSSKLDPSFESRPDKTSFDIYVPPDERLSLKKRSELISNIIQATIQFVIPQGNSSVPCNFQSYEEIREMFSSSTKEEIEENKRREEKKSGIRKRVERRRNITRAVQLWVMVKWKKISPNEHVKEIQRKLKKYKKRKEVEKRAKDLLKKILPNECFKEITRACKADRKISLKPHIIAEEERDGKDDEEWAWKDDIEFGRQMLAGINPTRIQSLETYSRFWTHPETEEVQKFTETVLPLFFEGLSALSHADRDYETIEVQEFTEKALHSAIEGLSAQYFEDRNHEPEEVQRFKEKALRSVIEGLSALSPENRKYVRRFTEKALHSVVEGHSALSPENRNHETEEVWRFAEKVLRSVIKGLPENETKEVWRFAEKVLRLVIEFLPENADEDSKHFRSELGEDRFFILDHHDYLMPFLSRINKTDVCAYASRTLLFRRGDDTLKPLAIELSLPSGTVFVPNYSSGREKKLWQLAKAHVAANDSGYHQLISHWLHTHAVVEPFIIATRRCLSVMHPIHRLLDPHFKDTMHINALARSIVINSGGILEKTLFSGPISMELSSELYKKWRFNEQALPVDLVKRGMAKEDSKQPAGVKLVFEDYPYGADGIKIWMAIKTWVIDFCNFFYRNDDAVDSDNELRAWWSEIKNEGHGDKKEGWDELKTVSDLIKILTTLIWIASGLHASVNFGQYAYAAYPPNRPTLCRKFVREDWSNVTDENLLSLLPTRYEMALSVAFMHVLSRHTSDEVYLGQRSPSNWIDNEDILENFKKFHESLRKIEEEIRESNRNTKLKNRWGPAKIPYKLLYPDTNNVGSTGGITGKGIPNSISI